MATLDAYIQCPFFSRWLSDRASPLPESFASPLEEALVSLCIKAMEKSVQLGKLKEINAILAEHFSGVEFINDIQGRLHMMSRKERTEELEVTRTDDYKDLLTCGTEIVGSCQHVEGNPQLNRALLGYVNDGKNQMLVVRSVKTGKTEARCIFRLLFKEHEGGLEPVLFEDRIYPPGSKQALVKALHEFAVAEAHRMGLPLYTINKGESVTEETASLISLGSVAPFEYEDAVGGVTNGAFVIAGAHKVKVV